MSTSIGIDLGTTYSSLSYRDVQTRKIVPLRFNNQLSIPSWISISTPGELLVGQEAKNDINSQCVGFNSKRLIGLTMVELALDYDEEENVETIPKCFPFQLEEKNNMICMLLSDPTKGIEEDVSFYPQEISGFIVKRMIEEFKRRYQGVAIEDVVVAVPNGFNDNQLKETETACMLAGIDEVLLTKEPTASILAFKHTLNNNPKLLNKYNVKNNEIKHIVVVDFGGGTLDVSYCQMEGDDIKVKKNRMDSYLGGNDFDEIMKELIKDKLQENDVPLEKNYFKQVGRDGRRTRIEKQKRNVRLQKMAEKLKIELSSHENVTLDLELLLLPVDYEKYVEINSIDKDIIIKRSEFVERCDDILYRFKECIKKLLKDSRMKEKDIDIVIPVGGSCCIPCVKKELENIFKKSMIVNDVEFDPLLSVANGCCIKANKQQKSIEKLDVYDVVSFGIGINHNGNEIDYFINDGEKIPHEMNLYFEPMFASQESVSYHLYKGYSKYTEDVDSDRINTMTILLPKDVDRNRFIMTAHCSVNTNGVVKIKVTYSRENQSVELGELVVKMKLDKTEEVIEEMKRHFNDYYYPMK